MADPTDDATDDVTDEATTYDDPTSSDAAAEAAVEGSAPEVGGSDDDDADDDDDSAAEVGASSTSKEAKAPFDPKADVEARRAATAAKMDAAKAKGKDGGAKAAAPMGKATAADPTGARAKREAASGKKVPRPSKRTGGVDPKTARKAAARSGNPKKAAEAADSTRYTPPIPRAQIESPTWVPVLMFTLLGLGGLVVLLTYMLWEGRPLALGAGLALILGGILTATQYR